MGLISDAHQKMDNRVIRFQGERVLSARDIEFLSLSSFVLFGNSNQIRDMITDQTRYNPLDRLKMPFATIHHKKIWRGGLFLGQAS